MKQLKVLSAVSLMALAGVANAGVSSTVTATNDYDFRGNSQSATDPALQASIDFAADFGGYVGAWASNVDFGDDTSYEVDLYGGYTKTFESGFGFDVGAVAYRYENHEYNFEEVYGSVTYKWLKAKLWIAPKFGGDFAEDYARVNAGDDSVSATYGELNLTVPLPANFSVLAHVGVSNGDYWDNVYGDDLVDYSLGVGLTAGNFNFALKYVDTDSDVQVTSDVFNNEGRVILTVATTFPWK